MDKSAQTAAGTDPIDALVPRHRPWWIRLAVASMLIVAVGVLGYWWNYGVFRPAPDCCGGGSSSVQIGLSHHDGAVTITGYFYNSSPRPVSIVGASADLAGATVVDALPFAGQRAFEIPPQNLADLPYVVAAHDDVWFAISFIPEQCSDNGADWGTLTLDLEVIGNPWYPTLGRSYENPEPIVQSGPNQLGILPPARLDGAFNGVSGPLEAACILLGR